MSSTSQHESSPSVQDIVIMETAKGCRQGMKPDDVQYHYNCWSEDGKYDEVGIQGENNVEVYE